MQDCIFCKIVAGQIPAEKIYEDEKVLAFLDINPVHFGHILIITKDHFTWMSDVPDDLLGHSFIKAKALMVRLKTAMEADLVTLSVVGRDVPHFHIHLVPRYTNDGLANWWPTKTYPDGKIKEIAEKIKNTLHS